MQLINLSTQLVEVLDSMCVSFSVGNFGLAKECNWQAAVWLV